VITSNRKTASPYSPSNRPDKLNALNAELLTASIDTLRKWSADPNVGAIVVTGAGVTPCCRAWLFADDVGQERVDHNGSYCSSLKSSGPPCLRGALRCPDNLDVVVERRTCGIRE